MSLEGWYAARTPKPPATPAGEKKKEKHMSEIVSAAPPSGGITWADHKGQLFIIAPHSVEKILTAFGESEAVRADAWVLTGPDTAEEFTDTLVFPKVLAGQLRGQIGSKVVGRLGQGNAKPGQSAPWILEPATPDDLAKASAYIARQTAPAVTSAAAPF